MVVALDAKLPQHRGVTAAAKRFLILAGASLAVATALGAFGAHVLEARLTPPRLRSFETAVSYQFFHSLGLFGLGLLLRDGATPLREVCGWMLVVGMLLFCGSIYAITFGAPRGVVALAPVGGATLIAAWAAFAFSMTRAR